jgi:hypothetical protein
MVQIKKQNRNLYYWFAVGEGTLPLHHLVSQNTPEKKNNSKKITNSHNHGITQSDYI